MKRRLVFSRYGALGFQAVIVQYGPRIKMLGRSAQYIRVVRTGMTKCRLKDADRLQLEILPRFDLCIGGQARFQGMPLLECGLKLQLSCSQKIVN